MRLPAIQPSHKTNFTGFMLLAAVTVLAGWGVALSPTVTTIVVSGAGLTALGLAWLAKNTHYSLIGGFVFLTILRPWPALGDSLVVGRVVDLVWLLLSLVLLYRVTNGGRRLLRIWKGSAWLLAMPLVTVISIVTAMLFFQQPVITRDLFELFRGPYYFLVLVVATQISWNDKQLSKSLFKPLILALWISFAVSVLQSPLAPTREIIEHLYTPKSARDILLALSSATEGEAFKLRTSGTFANPNWYGIALAVVTPFLLAGWSITNNTQLKVLTLITAIMSLFFLSATGSRTAVAAGILAVAAYFFLAAWDGIQAKRAKIVNFRQSVPWFPAISLLVVTLVLLVGLVFQQARFGELAAGISERSVSAVPSLQVKWTGAKARVLEAFERSPVLGLGPSKQVDQYLGDNQYSKVFYRYGVIGLIVWFGFWVAVLRYSLKARRRARTALQAGMARAVLATVPAFLLAGFGGSFFEAIQIATLYLLLIGIAFSSSGEETDSVSDLQGEG